MGFTIYSGGSLNINSGATLNISSSNGGGGGSGGGGNGNVQQSVGSAGGTVSISGQVAGSVQIPAGALASDVTITATAVSSSGVSISGSSTVGALLQMGPEGQTFDQPITITITVDLASLPAGVTINDLVIYTAPVGSGTYTALTTTVVDPTHISAQVSHFSNFAIAHPQVGTSALPKPLTPGMNSIDTFHLEPHQTMYYKVSIQPGETVYLYANERQPSYNWWSGPISLYEGTSPDMSQNTLLVDGNGITGGDTYMPEYYTVISYKNTTNATKHCIAVIRSGNSDFPWDCSFRIVTRGVIAETAHPTQDTGLVAWFKADSISALNGDTVSTWIDSSGHRQTLIGNPTYIASDSNLGGRPSLSFAGGKTLRDFFLSDLPTGSHARTMYVVGYLNDYGPGQGAASWGGTNGWLASRMGVWAYNGKLWIETSEFTSKGASISNGTSFVAAYPYAAGSNFEDSPFYVNGVQADQTPIGRGGNTPAGTVNTKFAVGYIPDAPGNNWGGAIAEILIYDSEHDDYARSRVETYLHNKYGFNYSLPAPNQNVKLTTFTINNRSVTDGQTVDIEASESPAGSGICSLSINAVTKDASATIVDGSGNVISFPYSININDGDSTNIAFTVVAADGVTTKSYSVTANVNKVTPGTPGLNSVQHFDLPSNGIKRFSFSIPAGGTVHCYGSPEVSIMIYEGTSPDLSQNTLVSNDRNVEVSGDIYMTYWTTATYTNTSNQTKNYIAVVSAFYGGGAAINGCSFRAVLQSPTSGITPPTQDTGLVAWFKADSISGLSDGDVVTRWNDSSGIDNFVLGNPQYVASDANLNNMPSVSFAGSRTATEMFNSSVLPKHSSARTVYMVGYLNDSNSVGMAFGYGYNSDSERFGMFSANGKVFVEACNHSSGQGSVTSHGGFVASFPYAAGTKLNQNIFYLNGTKNTTTDSGVLYSGRQDRLTMGYLSGYFPDRGYNWDGVIAEVLIYDSTHDDYARYRVESYLKAKYGLSYTLQDPDKNTDLGTFTVMGVNAKDGDTFNISLPESSSGSGTGTLIVNATTHIPGASITDGAGNALSFPLSISVSNGSNSVDLTVVSADGTTTQTYSMTVNATIVTNLGSGTFEDPYVLFSDGVEHEYPVTFGNDSFVYFKHSMDASLMGPTYVGNWGQTTYYTNTVQAAFRASWTPASGETYYNAAFGDLPWPGGKVRAQPVQAYTADGVNGRYWDAWANYQESDLKTAFFNSWNFFLGDGDAGSLGASWQDINGWNRPRTKTLTAYTNNSSHYGVTTTLGDNLFCVEPYDGHGFTGGTITVLCKVVTP